MTTRRALLTTAQKDHLVADYVAGVGTLELCEKYGIHRGSLYHLLRARGVALRQPRMSVPTSLPAGDSDARTDRELVKYLLERVKVLEGELDLAYRKGLIGNLGQYAPT